MSSPTRIGIIGAGRLGTALARQSLAYGYTVRIANSRGEDSLSLMISVLIPGAIAASIPELITSSDLIVLAIPLSKYRALPAELFAGKIVIDAMNYWAPTEGSIPEFVNQSISSSEHVQKYLPSAHLVKTLNHVAYNELEEHSLPVGDPLRRAIALAGDSEDAKKIIAEFISNLGFDSVDVGDLSAGTLFQPDTSLFNARYTKADLISVIAHDINSSAIQ